MLSFIVPAYNEELELPRTIEAIGEAAKDHQFEVIVVDDGSNDSTAEIAATAGAQVVAINRRQIAAARNAGARHAQGDILFFVDADTRINQRHIRGAIAALNHGYAGGGARVQIEGTIPLWANVCVRMFCAIYFGLNLGAGAFLFTSRKNFEAVGGFDEKLFIGEEVYFSIALRKISRFKILRQPILTSGRKLRMYSARKILADSLSIILHGPRGARSRDGLDLWYNGRREQKSI